MMKSFFARYRPNFAHTDRCAGGGCGRRAAVELLHARTMDARRSGARLAQRVPVRIKLDDVPADFALVSGRTATVSIGSISWWRKASLHC